MEATVIGLKIHILSSLQGCQKYVTILLITFLEIFSVISTGLKSTHRPESVDLS